MEKRITPLIAILFICLSCVPPAKFLAPKFEKPEIIAILPTINQTTDVEGGIVFRNLLYEKVKDEKYTRLITNRNVDSLLNLEGITDGGQLSTIKDEELFNILNVDGLMYVELLECTYQSLGIKETRHVKANLILKLYPGTKIWEDEREIKVGKSIFQTIFAGIVDPIGTFKETAQDLGEEYAVKALKMWLLDHELRPEMEEIIDVSVKTLPKSAPVHRHLAFSSQKNNLPVYKSNLKGYLDVETFTTNYFLVYQNENMNIRIGDAFPIVRFRNNTPKTIGIAEVARIQGKKVVLKHEMFDDFNISRQDKLLYGH
jgi:hypothetical protein